MPVMHKKTSTTQTNNVASAKSGTVRGSSSAGPWLQMGRRRNLAQALTASVSCSQQLCVTHDDLGCRSSQLMP